MVLIGKLSETETTCLLFKMPDDQLNVFIAFPYHILMQSPIYRFKIKIQVLGNENIVLSAPLYVTALLFPVQHIFLDFAMGVIQDPEVINDYVDSSGRNPLRELSYFTYNDNIYEEIINKEASILYACKSGLVNNLPTKILEMNYELGMFEDIELRHKMPSPGGFIKVDQEAKSGLSGSILVSNNNVIGMIVLSSSISKLTDNQTDNCCEKTSLCLATDMYYLYPHILQCASAIHKFTNNNSTQLLRLSNYVIFQTLNDDLLPIVNHLGGSFIFNQITNVNPVKHLTLLNIQNYLVVSDLSLKQADIANSIVIKTILNTNESFINYFFEKQQNSKVMIISAKYYDKYKKDWIRIDFENDPIFSNILDWCFRGDPLASLELTVKTMTLNNNGTVTISTPVSFTFDSSPTTDIIFNQNYPRTTMQIPSPFFNKINSSMILMNSFGLSNVQFEWLRAFNRSTTAYVPMRAQA